MTTATLTLSDFLLARIAEDEESLPGGPDLSGYVEGFSDEELRRIAAEWSAWERRWAAECESKRRIVEEFGSQCGGYYEPGTAERAEDEQIAAEIGIEYEPHWPEKFHGYCDGCAAAQSADADHARVLRLLALPYADHPDYCEEWRP